MGNSPVWDELLFAVPARLSSRAGRGSGVSGRVDGLRTLERAILLVVLGTHYHSLFRPFGSINDRIIIR